MMAVKKPKQSQAENQTKVNHQEAQVGEHKLSFVAAEAYKMLRTKLNLMLPRMMGTEDGEHVCRVIGATSALRGEGKSTTVMNLARTIAEASHKVCVVEADMRLPTLGTRLGLNSTPGLSNVLTGNCKWKAGIQEHVVHDDVSFSIITAGDIPPTPSELLESQNMERLLQELSQSYDYIIVDLPPVTVVTDALAVSKLLDGMLLIVRQNYCDKRSLKDVLYQFKLTETRVIGIVFNCSEGLQSGRSGYYKRRRYGRGYGKGYGYGYSYGYDYGYDYGKQPDH